jgi:hypothetical protein
LQKGKFDKKKPNKPSRKNKKQRGLCFLDPVSPHRTGIESRGGERNGYLCLSGVSLRLVFGAEMDGMGGRTSSAETSQGLSRTGSSTLPLCQVVVPISNSQRHTMHAFCIKDYYFIEGTRRQ